MSASLVKKAAHFRHELWQILKRIRSAWRLVPGRHKLGLGVGLGVMAVVSGCNTLIPVLLGRMISRVQEILLGGGENRDVYRVAMVYLGVLAGAYVLREVLNVVRRYMVENSCTRIERDTTIRLISHMMKVDLDTFMAEKVGALHSRIARSVSGFVQFVRLMVLDFAPALLTGGFALATAVWMQPTLGLLMLGVIPLSVLLTFGQLVSQKGIRLQLMRGKENVDGTVVELLNGIDYVRASNTHERETKRFSSAVERQRRKELRHHFQMSLFGGAKALNEGLFHILVLSYSIYLFVHGQVEFGQILTFSGLFLSVMAPLNEIHRVIDTAHESSLQVGDLLQMLHIPVDPSFERAAVLRPTLAPEVPLVEIAGLVVEYETADGVCKRALDGVSLRIRHGEKIGIAGPSGSGKSTWLKVLMRLTHPSAGTVRFGGVPIEQVSRDAIGELIGYVSQNPFLFSGTVRENIAYAKPTATADEIRRAAELASVHDEIMAMPQGYDSPLVERGQNLSGGQRQRVALARVFLKNPPILILDEATSALDTINERLVQQAVEAASPGCTVLHVAHRLSSLAKMDRIMVFKGGKLTEEGTHQELVVRGGVFTDLLMHSVEGVPDSLLTLPVAEKPVAAPAAVSVAPAPLSEAGAAVAPELVPS